MKNDPLWGHPSEKLWSGSGAIWRPQRMTLSDCLLKTQVPANSQEDV